MEFNRWFMDNFPDLYDAYLRDDYIARKYRKVIKKTFDYQQDKIEDMISKLDVVAFSAEQQSKLAMSDEFNRGWVSAWACIKEDLGKCK